jgi:hypothetical protein
MIERRFDCFKRKTKEKDEERVSVSERRRRNLRKTKRKTKQESLKRIVKGQTEVDDKDE